MVHLVATKAAVAQLLHFVVVVVAANNPVAVLTVAVRIVVDIVVAAQDTVVVEAVVGCLVAELAALEEEAVEGTVVVDILSEIGGNLAQGLLVVADT